MVMRCAHALDETALAIEEYQPAADLGTAAHDAMRLIVAGERVDVSIIARRHGVKEADLIPLVWNGRKAWEQLSDSFPLPETEVEVMLKGEPFSLTGHIDVMAKFGRGGRGMANVLDWKTSRNEEVDYYPQLCGYAACLFYGDDLLHEVTFSVVWLRSLSIETYTVTRDDVVSFLSRLQERLNDATYRTGTHCTHCRRSHDCAALVSSARRDMQIYADPESSAARLSTAPGAVVVHAMRRLKMLEGFAKDFKKHARERIATSGPIDSGDGYELRLCEENAGREIDPIKAWPILQHHLTDEEMNACITVSADAVDKAIAKEAPKGKAAVFKRQMAAELEAAGAITRGTRTVLREVRKPMELAKPCDGNHASPPCEHRECWHKGGNNK